MIYLTCCVASTAAKIRAMRDRERRIGYATARKAIGGETLDDWASAMRYDTGSERGGLRLQNDFAVSYYRSVYDGKPCVFIEHSAIEYIFVRG